MARQRRDWDALRADIYLHLGETEGSSFWTPAHLLMLFNEEKDLLDMQLQNRHEGFSVEVHYADIVADQAYYSIPEECGRLKRISRNYPGMSRIVPLIRNERLSAPMSTQSAGQYGIPDYRLIGNYIKLERTPSTAVTDGLVIEMEIAAERLTSGEDTLPSDWPNFAESLLVLRTTRAAFAEEQATDSGEGRTLTDRQETRLLYYETVFAEYTASRSFGRQLAVRYTQGG
jgi:hypothetical protein